MIKKELAIILCLIFLFQTGISENLWSYKKEKNKKERRRKKNTQNNAGSGLIFSEQREGIAKDSAAASVVIDTTVQPLTNKNEAQNDIIEPANNVAEIVKQEVAFNTVIVKEENNTALQKSTNSNESEAIHIAQENETLYTIARKYDIPVATLIKLNKLSSTEIKTGRKIVLNASENSVEKIIEPQQALSVNKAENPLQQDNIITKNDNKSIHIAQQDETLYTIARKYDIPVATLIKLNKLSSTEIKTGRKIVLNASENSVEKIMETEQAAIAIEPEKQVEKNIEEKKAEKAVVQEKSNQIAQNKNKSKKLPPGTLLIGCYAGNNNDAADILKERLQTKGLEAGYLYIPDYEPEGRRLYRVYVGPYANYTAAKVALKEIQKFRPQAYIFATK